MLIAFAIFGISVAVGLVTLVLYLNPGVFGRHETSIPGRIELDMLLTFNMVREMQVTSLF